MAWLARFGLFCVFLSLGTWALDGLGWVTPCTYCRFQRSIIGLLGLALCWGRSHPLIEYAALVIGTFGLYLASRQFMDNYLQSFFLKPNLYFSAGSLLIQVAELYLIFKLKDHPSK